MGGIDREGWKWEWWLMTVEVGRVGLEMEADGREGGGQVRRWRWWRLGGGGEGR